MLLSAAILLAASFVLARSPSPAPAPQAAWAPANVCWAAFERKRQESVLRIPVGDLVFEFALVEGRSKVAGPPGQAGCAKILGLGRNPEENL